MGKIAISNIFFCFSEIYGKDKIEKILNFKILLQNVNSLENNAVVELELSKVTKLKISVKKKCFVLLKVF